MEPQYPYSKPSSSNPQRPVIAIIFIAALALGGWWFWSTDIATFVNTLQDTSSDQDNDAAVVDLDTADSPPEPIETVDPEAINTVKQELQVSPTSESPVDTWLAAPSFLQRLVASVWKAAKGQSPAQLLTFVELDGQFQTEEREGRIYIDPQSYERYTTIVNTVVEVPPEKAALIYKKLRPQLFARFEQVAARGENFRSVARSALKKILAVKPPRQPVEVVEVGGIYYYADDRLQALSDIEKHVIRLGPDNIRRLKQWVRKFGKQAELL